MNFKKLKVSRWLQPWEYVGIGYGSLTLRDIIKHKACSMYGPGPISRNFLCYSLLYLQDQTSRYQHSCRTLYERFYASLGKQNTLWWLGFKSLQAHLK